MIRGTITTALASPDPHVIVTAQKMAVAIHQKIRVKTVLVILCVSCQPMTH
jgi:hypothetical protein